MKVPFYLVDITTSEKKIVLLLHVWKCVVFDGMKYYNKNQVFIEFEPKKDC